jgi:hypothetical protein
VNKIARPNVPGKRVPYLIGIQFEVALRGTNRFVKRQANLCSSQQTFGNCIFARLARRNLSQKQRLGLVELSDGYILGSHLVEIALDQFPCL